MTDTVTSRNGVLIRLTDEPWAHMMSRHPELSDQRERVLETLREPDMLQQGDFGELLAIRHYKHTPLTSKFMVVAYQETGLDDGFIITAYFTSRPLGRRVVLWKR